MAVVAEAPSTKGDRTRRRILEIAVRRFALDGYRRTSVADIARDAQLSPAAVYAYFAGKEALFEAAVDADASGLIEAVREVVQREPVRTRAGVTLVSLAEGVTAFPLAARVLSGREPDVIDRVLDLPSLQAFTAETARAIAVAQGAGTVRTDVDAETMAAGIEAIILALLMGSLQAHVEEDSRFATGAVAVLDAVLSPPS